MLMARSIKVALVMLSVVSGTPHIHPVRPTVTDAVTLYRYAPGAYGGGATPQGKGETAACLTMDQSLMIISTEESRSMWVSYFIHYWYLHMIMYFLCLVIFFVSFVLCFTNHGFTDQLSPY